MSFLFTGSADKVVAKGVASLRGSRGPGAGGLPAHGPILVRVCTKPLTSLCAQGQDPEVRTPGCRPWHSH